MKKLISLISALALIMSLAACNNNIPEGDKGSDENNRTAPVNHTIETKTFPFYVMEPTSLFDLTLDFLDGVNDLPYIEVYDSMYLLSTLYWLFEDSEEIDLNYDENGSVVTVTRKNKTYNEDTVMTMDFDKDILRFQDYDLFTMFSKSSTISDMTTFLFFDKQQNKYRLIKKMDSQYSPRFGSALEINLANYGIDLVYQDEKYLIPLQTINDIFIAPVFLSNIYFNGRSVILIDDLSKKTGQAIMRNLYYNDSTTDNGSGNFTGVRSEELTKFGYGELCMMLDNLYGLKEQHNISSFDKMFQEVGSSRAISAEKSLKAKLTGTDVFEADKAIYTLIGDFLDDNHCKWFNFSYLAGQHDGYEPNGMSRTRINNFQKRQEEAREKYYPEADYPKETYPYGIPGYEKVNNTAYITFDNFSIDAEFSGNDNIVKYYEEEDPNSFPDNDTIGLIMKAHHNIINDPDIENVVIDLSNNTGGFVDMAVFVIAWFLGEATVGINYTMTGSLCNTSYRCDANRDYNFDENDTLGNRKLFCLISPVSFSCGNLVPCLFKESSKVTLLGKRSGGGACAVQPVSSAWGTSFRISGPRRICYIKNGSYYDIDQGAEPDYTISDPDNYYNRTELTAYINSLK